MTQEEITVGIDYPFAFRNLTECVCHIQHNNSYIRYKDADGLINEFQVIGFANLTVLYIEVVFMYSLKRPNGQLLRDPEKIYYQEPDIWPFMLAAGLPIGIWEFGMKQGINGLMRRRAEFDGNEQQSGHRLFNEIGSPEQPLVFDFINVVQETAVDDGLGNLTGQQDASFEVSVLNGSGGYEYSLDDVTYVASPVFSNLSAEDYTVYVRDQAGIKRFETITIKAIVL